MARARNRGQRMSKLLRSRPPRERRRSFRQLKGLGGGFGVRRGGPRRMRDPPARLGDNADGVRVAGQHMSNAVNARWPMYLRNVKQILRAAGFDERRYGFGGLLELLKACQ